jgi:cytochrome c556
MPGLQRWIPAVLVLLAGAACADDARQAVALPEAALQHEHAVMRDHLAAIARIEHDLASRAYDDAAATAQAHLSLEVMTPEQMEMMHRYMPPPMQSIGMQFHKDGADLALQLQNASVSGDSQAALQALARVTDSCVACHADYRFVAQP